MVLEDGVYCLIHRHSKLFFLDVNYTHKLAFAGPHSWLINSVKGKQQWYKSFVCNDPRVDAMHQDRRRNLGIWTKISSKAQSL